MSADGTVTALVVAGGLGTRLPGRTPKGLRPLGGDSLFLHSLRVFDEAPSVGPKVLVVPQESLEQTSEWASKWPLRPVAVVAGGARRQDSVFRGLEAAQQNGYAQAEALVAVHDAARPFLDVPLIERTIAAARVSGAAVPMVPIVDTVRELAPAGGRPRLLDRQTLRLAQTPQTSRLDWILEAYRRAEAEGATITDEGAALERAGFAFSIVEGSPGNFKITTAEELEAAEGILALRRGVETVRIGYGEDRHPRAAPRPFVLAGVQLDEKNGPIGHSDGDPLCHALIDALLGAAGEGTIGDMFPDTDPRWAGAAGLDLLRAAVEHLAAAGWKAVNVDAVVVADAPRLAPHRPEIRRKLAEVLGIDPARVSVKGKRAEGLGFEGAGGGVSCRAVVLLGRMAAR